MWKIFRWYMRLGKWAADIGAYEDRLRDAAAGGEPFNLTRAECADVLEAGKPVFDRARKLLVKLG